MSTFNPKRPYGISKKPYKHRPKYVDYPARPHLGPTELSMTLRRLAHKIGTRTIAMQLKRRSQRWPDSAEAIYFLAEYNLGLLSRAIESHAECRAEYLKILTSFDKKHALTE